MYQRKRLLIWGTTYPEFSKTYFETVCTGAVDEESGKLIRIYPVTLRHLDERFHHYDWISADIEKNAQDVRPESYRIHQDSIEVGDHIDTDKLEGWQERSKWILRDGSVFKSLEALRAAQEKDGTSLGIVKPAHIEKFYAVNRNREEQIEWEKKRDSAAAQKDMFVDGDSKVRDLRFPFAQYRAKFTCDDAVCKGHDASILDWGIQVLDFKLTDKHLAENNYKIAEEKVLRKLREMTDPIKKEAYFFLGNTLAHPQNFMIVGLYYPPRSYQNRLL